MTYTLPGDQAIIPLSDGSGPVRLGPGLLRSADSDALHVTRAGVLAQVSSGSGSGAKVGGWWVDTNSKRYIPAPGDSVIGQVTHRSADGYILSLSSAHGATLPALAFEGATKRHRPNLRVGALVYARVVAADRHAEPEVTCVDPVTGKADGFGELKLPDRETGHMMLFRCSLGLARSLLRPTHPLLPMVASHFPFEAAVGHNGSVWVRAGSVAHIITFGAILRAADEAASGVSAEADEAVERKAGKKAKKEVKRENGEVVAGALSEAHIDRIVSLYN